jgi:hypothetical protein
MLFSDDISNKKSKLWYPLITEDFSGHLAEVMDQGVPLLVVDGLGPQRGIHLEE